MTGRRKLGLASDDASFNDEDYPLPPGCTRFIVPPLLVQTMRAHPLTRGLHPYAAGFYRQDTRFYECVPLAADLLYFCTAGSMTLHAAGSSRPVATGDLVLVPAGLAHSTQASEQVPCSFYFASYGGELADEYTEFLRAPRLVNHLGLDPELVAEFDALCTLRTSDFAIDTLVAAASRFASLLTRLSLALSRGERSSAGRIDLAELRRLMSARLADGLTLGELAAHANLSDFHFARLFKKQTGMSPISYHIHMRIQHACQLLDSRTTSIKQIAEEVGYDDPLYFSRVFRRVVGVTPSAYRNWDGEAYARTASATAPKR